ncbi:MAG: 30S ribosomal protein S20 [Spirochaetota bacterium]|nr:MAG: 30S ribosomal protein S20 [Spirochaetota bacterium]
MAVHTSVMKRARQNKKERQRNRIWKSRIKTAQSRIEDALTNKEAAALEGLYREYCSLIDKAVSKNVIHRNNASRKKTQLAQRLHSLPPSK